MSSETFFARGFANARSIAALAASGALALLVACASTHVKDSAVDHAATSATELDFWQGLETQPLLSNHDALHGLLLLAESKDDDAGFAERLAEARRRGWLDATAELDPDAAAGVGFVAVALCEVLKIEGGLTMKLLGRSPRYCTRALIDAGLLPDRSPNQVLRGPEFIDLVAHAEDWRAAHGGAP
jgi:hypothetical protein